MPTGTLFDIKKYSINDGPGIRTTLFLKGCPLRCWWCHNPESQSTRPQVILRPNRCEACGACLEACKRGAISWSENGPLTDRAVCNQCGVCAKVCFAEARQLVGYTMDVEEAMNDVLADLPFYEQSGGGVTLSGGEPLLQADFCQALLQACREHAIHTVVDTCGQVTWSAFEQVLPYVDLFLYDIKLEDADKHRNFTGVSNERILANLQELNRRGANLLVRIPVIPGVNDDEGELRHMAALLLALPHPPAVELLAYHHSAAAKYAGLGRDYALEEALSPSVEEMQAHADRLSGMGLVVKQG